MTVTIEEVNSMYKGIVEAVEALGYHPNKLERPIYWSNSKRVFGNTTKDCRFKTPKYYIDISKPLTLALDNPFELYETIAHETIHTVDGCMDHGPKWKKIVGLFNAKYGTKISRTSSLPEGLIESSPYVLECTECGKRFAFQRMCKTVKFPELYQCGECKGDLKRIA